MFLCGSQEAPLNHNSPGLPEALTDVGVEQAPCAGALRPPSVKMAPVEHVVADAGAFLRDAALQVRGDTEETKGFGAGGP